MDALGGSGLIDVKLEEVSPGQQRASLTPTERRGGFIGEDTDSSNIASLGILPVFIDRTKIAAVPLPVA
jgi:hypothetical protein